MHLEQSGSRLPLDTSWLIRAGLVAAAAAALVVSGFASLEAVADPFVLGNPGMTPNASPYWFGGALAVLVAIHAAASWLTYRDLERRRFVWWILGISAAGVVWFGWLALLSVSFWSTARADVTTAETLTTGLLYFVALAGPSVSSLVATVFTALVGSRKIPILLPPAVFFVGAAASIAIPVVHFALLNAGR